MVHIAQGLELCEFLQFSAVVPRTGTANGKSVTGGQVVKGNYAAYLGRVPGQGSREYKGSVQPGPSFPIWKQQDSSSSSSMASSSELNKQKVRVIVRVRK